jgi:hypothetical protein
MSEEEASSSGTSNNGALLGAQITEASFNFAEWVTTSKLTEPGRKKLVTNALVDFESLIYLTDEEVLDIRLALGDRIKFTRHLNVFKRKPASLTSGVSPAVEQVSTGGSPAVDSTLPLRDQPGVATGAVSQVVGQQTFSFQEVASFMAGGNVPQNLQVEANKIHSAVLTGQQPLLGTPACPQQGIPQFPVQQSVVSPLQSAIVGLQIPDS